MSSAGDLKKRMSNISSVEQLIHAMDMVASTKLVGARRTLEGIRPMYTELKNTVEELGHHEENSDHKYFKQRPVKNSLYIVFSSDRGLAGSYNSNILNKALDHMNEQDTNEQIVVIGSVGHEFFKKNKKNIIKPYYNVSSEDVYFGAQSIAEDANELFQDGEVDEIFLVYTDFENMLKMNPHIERLLPLEIDTTHGFDDAVEYEPTIDVFIEHVVPLYLHMSIFGAFAEADASEQASRSISMDAASENAEELLEDLESEYNRERQAAITEELNEIVSSAQAMDNI